MEITLGLLVLIGCAVGIGLERHWRLGTWSVAFAAGAWILAALAVLRAQAAPSVALDYVRHAKVHRESVLALALSCEAAFAAVVLAIVGWRAGRRASTIALWLCSLWAGLQVALAG